MVYKGKNVLLNTHFIYISIYTTDLLNLQDDSVTLQYTLIHNTTRHEHSYTTIMLSESEILVDLFCRVPGVFSYGYLPYLGEIHD